jgi:membrane protease YdiL (CAAX protease family)
MAVLGWFVAPAFAPEPGKPGFERLGIMTIGLIWQFILSMVLVYREAGNLRWTTIKECLWLNHPHSPKTGRVDTQLWWWIAPLIIMTAVYEMQISGLVDRLWLSFFPFFKEPSAMALMSLLDSPHGKAQMVGNWGVLVLFVVSSLLNTFIGEEFIFRGILLPRMTSVFGRWDWIANGVLFGLYHLHQPLGILSGMISGMFLFALPSKAFRSSWFGITLHSGQSVFFFVLMLGLVLGLAY